MLGLAWVRVGSRFALHSHSKQQALLAQCAVPAHNALQAQLEISALRAPWELYALLA